MFYAGRLLYVDLHPGNFLFMEDGRLGVIDCGCMVELDDGLWELSRKNDRPMTTGTFAAIASTSTPEVTCTRESYGSSTTSAAATVAASLGPS